MKWLLDTGILLRLVNRADPLHTEVVAAAQLLYRRREELVMTAQNIAEFWNVSTRPTQARGGLGRTVAETERCVQFFESLGAVIPDASSSYGEWKRLAVTHQVSGKAVHDARLVALMNVSAVTELLTLNPNDFARYSGLNVLTPQDVLATP